MRRRLTIPSGSPAVSSFHSRFVPLSSLPPPLYSIPSRSSPRSSSAYRPCLFFLQYPLSTSVSFRLDLKFPLLTAALPPEHCPLLWRCRHPSCNADAHHRPRRALRDGPRPSSGQRLDLQGRCGCVQDEGHPGGEAQDNDHPCDSERPGHRCRGLQLVRARSHLARWRNAR